MALLLAGTALTLSGCCNDSDKQSLRELVDRAIDRNFKACESIPDSSQRAACISNAQTQQTALVTAYANYLTACATGNSQRIKDAIDALKDLLKSSNKVAIGASGSIVNSEMILSKDESVCLSILLSSDGSVKPQDFVVVNGSKYLPEAAGSAALSSGTAGAVSVATAVGDFQANSSVTYVVAPGSTICFSASGMSVTASIEGSLSISSTVNGPSAIYVPTEAKLVVDVAGSKYTMTLDKACKYNAVTLDAAGAGTLAMRVDFSASGTASLPARLPEGGWMVLPVQRNSTGTQLQISSGNVSLPGQSVFPTLPNPIADFDRNGVADNADVNAFMAQWSGQNSSADVNHDGTVNAADYDLFLNRWDSWRQP
ncbi:MAG: hypothetical protein IOD15_06545 [Phycisphaerales bacterium]|jgi:hypothetical protein|nr:hypothetical protein [Phycisphaerales bacterium]